ncbi:hypothetical protein [Flavobacterium psychrotrophum]|uniref:hypothetical protein n=1 Tax=Flavobacterium psychrotrophum TaxID=2294119 RepID=UPI000E322EE9|nr:hypothetical protein [Flavobacterium psychrotrophum]
MKKALLIIAFILFALPAIAQQGDNQERQDQMPPPVTERQIEKDAKAAQEERKKNEDAEKKEDTLNKENTNKSSDNKPIEGSKNPSSGKTSNTPGKQQ